MFPSLLHICSFSFRLLFFLLASPKQKMVLLTFCEKSPSLSNRQQNGLGKKKKTDHKMGNRFCRWFNCAFNLLLTTYLRKDPSDCKIYSFKIEERVQNKITKQHLNHTRHSGLALLRIVLWPQQISPFMINNLHLDHSNNS